MAEAIVFPVALTQMQKKDVREQLAASRKKKKYELTEVDRLSLEILQLKFEADKELRRKVKMYIGSLRFPFKLDVFKRKF
jgi:hypothetical protein